jgi:phosphoglycolate phosphatase
MTAVVFDLDGTLVDSTPDIATALNRVLARGDLAPLPEDVVRELTGYGGDELVRRAFAARGVTLDDDEIAAETRRYLDTYAEHPVERTVVFADAEAALAELNRRGVALGVCTNKDTALARTVLRALGLDSFLGVVLGADAVARRKPDPEHLLAALRALGTAPADALYVGDKAIDADTARAAGVRCALVAWGDGHDRDCPRIDRFADLLDLVLSRP